MSNTSSFANRGLDAQRVEHRSDNLVGYVIVETWKGERPGIIGLPTLSKASVQELLEDFQAKQPLNPSREWQLAKVETVPPLYIVPPLPEKLPDMTKLPDTPWWGVL